MTTSTRGEWTVDVEAMTCRNRKQDILIIFEWKGKTLIGNILDMPILLMKWKKLPIVNMSIERIIMEAKDVFLQAYTENNIEKNIEQTDA
jgi:hypothetical protein